MNQIVELFTYKRNKETNILGNLFLFIETLNFCRDTMYNSTTELIRDIFQFSTINNF